MNGNVILVESSWNRPDKEHENIKRDNMPNGMPVDFYEKRIEGMLKPKTVAKRIVGLYLKTILCG